MGNISSDRIITRIIKDCEKVLLKDQSNPGIVHSIIKTDEAIIEYLYALQAGKGEGFEGSKRIIDRLIRVYNHKLDYEDDLPDTAIQVYGQNLEFLQ